MFMTDGNSPAVVETAGKLSPMALAAVALEPESIQHVKQQQQQQQERIRVPGGGGGDVHQAPPKREFASADEKLKRKRNREEIGTLYTAYRRLKFCLARQDESNFDLQQDLEVAYNSVLELSKGK